MVVYRLCKRQHASLDGEGARLFGGRWNSRGVAAIYTSESLALAVLESLVHFDLNEFPEDLVWLSIKIPEGIRMTQFAKKEIQSQQASRIYGDERFADLKTVGLVVPSVVIPIEKNVILNPCHPEMSRIKIQSCEDFQLDLRFAKSLRR